jgi:TPR repeat protein
MAKAIALYISAAKENNAQAQSNLGFCYERGLNVPQNLAEADRLYKVAASKGHPQAQASLANFFEHGIAGNPKDLGLAMNLYASAAKRGDLLGMFKLGRCYELGIGTERDAVLALKWYKKAIAQDHASAMVSSMDCQGHAFLFLTSIYNPSDRPRLVTF